MSTHIGLVLAAGAGVRFGAQPKLLAALPAGKGKSEQTVLGRVLRGAIDSGCYQPIVVAIGGRHQTRLAAYLRQWPVTVSVCAYAEQGQGAVLQHNLTQLFTALSVTVILGDLPLIRVDTHQILRQHALANPNQIVVPAYQQQWGHPVIFPKAVFATLRSFLGGTRGAGGWLRANRPWVTVVEVDDSGVIDDLDSYRDWQRMTGNLD